MLHFIATRPWEGQRLPGRPPHDSENTPTVLIEITSDEGNPLTAKYSICGAGQAYKNKRTFANFIKEFGPIDGTNATSCDMAATSYVLYSWVDGNIGPLMIEALRAIHGALPEDENGDNITALISSIESTGKYKRRRLNEAGAWTSGEELNLSGEPIPEDPDDGEDDDTPGTGVPTGTPNFGANDTLGIIDLIKQVDPSVKYLGFNAKFIRDAFLTKRPDNHVAARDLILIFTGYAHVGNNSSKLGSKRVNLDISRSLMSQLGNLEVVKRATDSRGMTLARAGIAFMPEYLIYRRFITKDLQDQTESTISVVYKDICFYGCDQIRGMPGYTDFHKEFSSFIYKPGKDTPLDDKDFLSSYKKWNKVSISGYKADSQIHSKMIAAIGLPPTTTQHDAINLIVNSMATYRPTTTP